MAKIGDPRTPEERDLGVPPPQRPPSQLPLKLEELFGQFRLKAFKASGQPVKLLAENDGTLRLLATEWNGTTAVNGTKKSLGKSLPAAATETTIYTTPALTIGEVQKVTITNTGGKTTFSLGIAVGGGSVGTAEFLFKDAPIAANTTVVYCGPDYLAATDLLRGESASGSVSFAVDGIEWA